MHEEDLKKSIQLVTSSFGILQLLQQYNFDIVALPSIETIDIYFDGCDQFDKDLNALKSGGGIHTREKLLASMAKEFILVGDETKYTDTFDNSFPLVVDVLPEAFHFAIRKIHSLFTCATATLRMSSNKDGAVITENGNYLIDIKLQSWPELSTINTILKSVTGIVETSLFYNLASKAIIAGSNGIQVLEASNRLPG